MYPRGTRKGLRRVACATERAVPLFSSTTGVVMGEPRTIKRAWSPNPNLLRPRLPNVFAWLFGDTSAFGMPGAVERDRSLNTPAFRKSRSVVVSAAHTYGKLFHAREASVRWTKKWQRFNPGRCHDCDLRFSFPHSSRTLPFSSHDARVEMGRSVMPD